MYEDTRARMHRTALRDWADAIGDETAAMVVVNENSYLKSFDIAIYFKGREGLEQGADYYGCVYFDHPTADRDANDMIEKLRDIYNTMEGAKR